MGDGKVENPAPGKRRSFLATRQDKTLEAETRRIRTEVVDAFPVEKNDDIPVLTEIVPTGNGEHEAEETGEAPSDLPASHEIDLEELTGQMIEAIERQLAYELPTLIEASLLNISADLRNGIASTMQTALREFAAHREKTQLPDEHES